ncbi:MAG: L-threonylcarbamoyladenylate synthase [Anaerolineaceae bacterium]|nr:L-threonylcarbamoyladenylate synthase [Anaerolineaceae bacterium]
MKDKRMKHTQVLSIEDPRAILSAIEIIAQGGLIAFPTDTIYGVACDPHNGSAILDLYKAKNRPPDKAIPVLIGNIEQLYLLTPIVKDRVHRLADAFWPGALTLVLPKKEGFPKELSRYNTIGLRMPNHAFTIELLQKSGPLATTSANLSGSPNLVDAQDVLSQLGGRIELVLDGGRTAGETASTVVDCTHDDLIVLRQGLISIDELNSIWEKAI